MTDNTAHGGCRCHDKSSGPATELKKLGAWAGLRLLIEFVVNAFKD